MNVFQHRTPACPSCRQPAGGVHERDCAAVKPADACDLFVPSLGAMLGSAPWQLCKMCDFPKAQHEMPHCRSQAIVAGVIYECERRTPHKGVRCKSGDAEWGTE